MKIFVCGFSGAGKTTFGDKLSKHPTFQVFDLDEEILNRMGAGFDNLGEYIEEVGMPAFRIDELDMVQLLDQNLKDNYLITLGGGALESPKILEFVQSIGAKLVFLDTTFEQCWRRLEDTVDRPLKRKGKEFMKSLYEQRQGNYLKSNIKLSPIEQDDINTIEELQALLN